jgi:outer membrane protein with beta-barrel domain
VRGLYGSALGDAELNGYGPGFGLRAGVTLPASLYLGASFDYFFGETDSVAGVDISASVLQVLANVGYDAGLGPITLRPNLGFGLAQTEAELEDASTSEGNFAISPGVEAFLGLGLLTVSGELRYNHIFAEGDGDAIIVGVGLGLTL